MDKFIEVKEATRNILRSSSADTRQTSKSETDRPIQSGGLEQENAQLKLALAQR